MAQRVPPIPERLVVIQALLMAAPPASTHDEAFVMLTAIINNYEDEHSGVPYAPEAARITRDGRIYPPEPDAEKTCSIADCRRYRTRGHNVIIGNNGAIAFENVLTGIREFSKAGGDGKEIKA